ncbi:MAG TPA: hypothetical protein VFZ97_00860 [Acidimicrobiales bacterium]
MSAEVVLTTVIDWFRQAKVASLELPDGWFGGPGRSLHQLTKAEVWNDRLLLELDEQLLLVLTAPAQPVVGDEELVIDSYDQLVFDWQEYGNKRPHAEVYRSGSIRFVAQHRPGSL